jgi:hypothetical protein
MKQDASMRAHALPLLIALLASTALAGPKVTAVTAEEDTLRGELLAVDDQPSVTLRLDDEPRRIPCGDLLELRFQDEAPARRPQDAAVRLRDGGVLRGAVRGGGGDAVALHSARFGAVRCPLDAVARIELPAARGAGLFEAAEKADRLFLQNDEVVEGTVQSIDAEKVVFRSGHLGELDVPFDRLRAVAFAAQAGSERQPEGVVAIVHTDDGSVVRGRLRSLADGALGLKALFGADLAVDIGRVLRIGFRGGRLVYLSDLEPAEVKETPFFDIIWHSRRDQSVDGNPLRIGQRTYRKGLGVHTRCEMTFALDGAYQRFLADVGIDEEVGPAGNADVRVLVDGQVKFEKTGLTGRDGPVRVEVDVADAQRLTLVADFGAELDIADHVNWANGRLIR